MRDVYLKPPDDFNVDPDQLLQLVNPLYGLSEIGGYWDRNLRTHWQEDLGMNICVSDPAFFYKQDGHEGICTNYVDDSLHTGSNAYSNLTRKLKRHFFENHEIGIQCKLQV